MDSAFRLGESSGTAGCLAVTHQPDIRVGCTPKFIDGDRPVIAPQFSQEFREKGLLANVVSNRHPTRCPPRDLQQVRLHENDLVVAVPFAGEEVRQAICLESNRAVDEPILVASGVIPERVRVPERDVSWVLERISAIGAGGLLEQPTLRGQAAVDFPHRVNRLNPTIAFPPLAQLKSPANRVTITWGLCLDSGRPFLQGLAALFGRDLINVRLVHSWNRRTIPPHPY